jgi:AraC family transcriptional regulator
VDPIVERSETLAGAYFEIRRYVEEDGSQYALTLEDYSVSMQLSHYRTTEIAARFVTAADTPFTHLGAISFVPAGVPYHARTSDGVMRVLVCRISRDRFEPRLTRSYDWSDPRLRACMSMHDPFVRAYMVRAEEEFAHPGANCLDLLDRLVDVLTYDVGRFLERLTRADEAGRGRLAEPMKELLLQRIDDVAAPIPTVRELAALTNLSASYLNRLFKNEVGLTLGTVLGERKLERARRLLRDGKHPIKEIAWLAGFSGPSSFTYAFQRATGESPNSYRRREARPEAATPPTAAFGGVKSTT